MNDQWYYGENDKQHGPVSLTALRDRLSAGLTRGGDLVWRDGMPAWTPAADVPELADLAGPASRTGTAGGYVAQPAYAGQPADAVAAGGPLGYYAESYAGAQYVGFWWRVLASIIDGFVTGIGGVIVGGVAGALIGLAMGNGQNVDLVVTIVSQLLGAVVGWLYSALMEASAQQATLGKMAIGVRVTDLNGERLSFGRATGRFFAKYVSSLTLGIGFLMVAFTERKQGLHDMIAGTLVLKGRPNVDPRGFPVR